LKLYYIQIVYNSLKLQPKHLLIFSVKINVYVAVYFVGLPACLETNALPYGITASETGAQYKHRFSIILNQMTISEFLHNSFSDFFYLKLLFCSTRWLKTQLCCGKVYLAKISIYFNHYFIGLPAPLENNPDNVRHYCLWKRKFNTCIVFFGSSKSNEYLRIFPTIAF